MATKLVLCESITAPHTKVREKTAWYKINTSKSTLKMLFLTRLQTKVCLGQLALLSVFERGDIKACLSLTNMSLILLFKVRSWWEHTIFLSTSTFFFSLVFRFNKEEAALSNLLHLFISSESKELQSIRNKTVAKGLETGTQTHTANSSAHTWMGLAHKHTLLVEHLNHISRLPAIHHSHRQKHMQERRGNCMATCITARKQTHTIGHRAANTPWNQETAHRKMQSHYEQSQINFHSLPCISLSAHIYRTFRDGLICRAVAAHSKVTQKSETRTTKQQHTMVALKFLRTS